MFAVKLSLQTGWRLCEILAMPWPLLALYMGGDRLEPFGGKAADRRAGEQLALFYNANRGRDAPALKPEDWFPSLGPPPEIKAAHDHAVQVWRGRIEWAKAEAALAKQARLAARKKPDGEKHS